VIEIETEQVEGERVGRRGRGKERRRKEGRPPGRRRERAKGKERERGG